MVDPGGNRSIALLVHALPGRTRLRVPEQRHRQAWFADAAQRLSQHPRVQRVTVNAQTGSVLLQHEGSVRDLTADLADWITIVPRPPRPVRRPALPGSLRVTPATAMQALAMGSVALGVWQARRGRLLASAIEHLWHARGAWRILKAPALTAAFAGGALVQLGRGQILSSAASLMYYAARLRRGALPD
ncbi:MAG TPA: hypothetical protein VHY82_03870 [Acetobacteraceae bacterium]|jgi:hypothetical protein|nr:hypothetical protein [Acetobacteraceae bacterium]